MTSTKRMEQSLEKREILQTLDAVIAEFSKNPVDLLGIGDEGGETTYIANARCSYERTLCDIISLSVGRSDTSLPVRVLEIGSYLGVVTVSLARMGYSVTALDIPEFMENERLQERYIREGVSVISANLRDYKIPADSESFDIVVMCETLEHLNFNPLPVISEINRVIRKGGHLYLSLPNLSSLVNRAKLLAGRSINNPVSDFVAQLSRSSNMIVGIHWREYTYDELRELLRLGGLSASRHYYFTSHRASLPARMIYAIIPSMRQNQTLIACKESPPPTSFNFTDATR